MLAKCKQALLDKNINPASGIDYDINGTIHSVTLEWIISAYLKTEKKELFVELFKKVLTKNDHDIEVFFQQMGQLVLMSSLSEQMEAGAPLGKKMQTDKVCVNTDLRKDEKR